MEKNIRIISRLIAIAVILISILGILGYLKSEKFIPIAMIGIVILNFVNAIYEKRSKYKLLFTALFGTVIIVLLLI
ncbi:hypothetical protein RJG79_09190 [Mycoplasmatota bacterium WC44]